MGCFFAPPEQPWGPGLTVLPRMLGSGDRTPINVAVQNLSPVPVGLNAGAPVCQILLQAGPSAVGLGPGRRTAERIPIREVLPNHASWSLPDASGVRQRRRLSVNGVHYGQVLGEETVERPTPSGSAEEALREAAQEVLSGGGGRRA